MVSIADIEHAMIRYLKTFEQYKEDNIGVEKFTDGWAFATILKAATNFKISYGDLIESSGKWTFKLSNLKKIVSLIEEYFEYQINKEIRTKDIDLIQIAKNNSVQEIAKFFELIIAVMTEAPNKEDHISTIMSLDERSQATFVEIIQNILENRVFDGSKPKQDKIYDEFNQLQNENILLKQEIQAIFNHNFMLEKQIEQYKIRQKDYEDQLEELRGQKIDRQVPHDQSKQKDHLKNMVDNLKQKLLCTVREHQMKISQMKEQYGILENKLMKYEEIEEQLDQYKKKYSETIESYGKLRLWEKEKSKLHRILDEKEEIIKKLNQKLNEEKETNYQMQQKQLYAKMELEKRDIRFKELEKQVKKRYESGAPTVIPDHTATSKLSSEILQIDQQEMEELRSDLQAAKKKLRESERQRKTLKSGIQKVNVIESEKKKLQKLIMDLTNEKKQHIELLLSTSYDLYVENMKLRSQIEGK